MAPGSRPVDSAARGGPWLRKATRACPELGAPTAASGEAPSGPVGRRDAGAALPKPGQHLFVARAVLLNGDALSPDRELAVQLRKQVAPGIRLGPPRAPARGQPP